jgi:hypothetical protein
VHIFSLENRTLKCAHFSLLPSFTCTLLDSYEILGKIFKEHHISTEEDKFYDEELHMSFYIACSLLLSFCG